MVFSFYLMPVLGFPSGASGKEPVCQYRIHKRCRFHPWVGKVPGEGNGNPVQYSCLENPMDRGTWRATVHSVTKSQTRLKRLSSHSTMPILEIAFLLQLGMRKQKSAFFPESKKKQKEILLSIQVSYGSLVGSQDQVFLRSNFSSIYFLTLERTD